MEEYSNVTIACMKCKNKVQIKSMKYSKNGEDLICQDCANVEKGVKPAASVTGNSSSSILRPMPAGSPSAAIAGAKYTDPSLQKVSYECQKCGYKFTRNKDIPVITCPYCNGGPLSKSESFGFYKV